MNESWSRSERRRRAKKCGNPKGFTMRQFCKNIRSRSKKGQKTNELFEAIFERLLQEELKVKATIKPSVVDGLGLFAAKDIPKGTTVFTWNDDIDQEYSQNYVNQLPLTIKNDFIELASTDGNKWYLAGDGGAYFNHSLDPNIEVEQDEEAPAKWIRKAARDILAGEEMTMDYSDIGNDVPR